MRVPDPGAPSPGLFHDVIVRFADLLESRGVTYMIVGAVAAGAWGRPRATLDIDVTVLTDAAGGGGVVDVMRPRGRHGETALQRRRAITIERRRLWFAAPDDLILMKLQAGRPRDFEDALAVLAAQREALDQAYMLDWAARLGIADELAYVLREGGFGER